MRFRCAIPRAQATVAAAVAAGLAGCAGIGLSPAPAPVDLSNLELVAGPAVETIPDFRIDGFKVIGPRHVLLSVGASRRYLIGFSEDCPGLASAPRLGYTTTAGAVRRRDTLVPVDQTLGAPCQIDSMRPVQAAPPTR